MRIKLPNNCWVAVIGAGVMGGYHCQKATSLPGITLVGIADPDIERANKIASTLNVQPYSDFRELLTQADTFILATPTKTHYPIAKEIILAGKNLLVEKPFTGDHSKAEELIALAKEKKVLLSAGFIEAFNPAFIKLRKLIKGEKILGLNFQRLSPFPERIADTNVIFDMMIHDLFLFGLLLPPEIDSLKAQGKKGKSGELDEVTAVFALKNGVICRLEASRIFGVKSRNISVTLEKEVVEADLLNKRIYCRDFSSPTPSTVPVKNADQLTEELKAFFGAIKGKSALPFSPEEAALALKLAKEVENAC